ncbi:PAS domain S-box protein [Formosa algae]|uniref:histidine kinase n=1 Tax=Formosa algae TaxID=225843 RepID=A0A9X0YP67_9FLAO|nr:PAS domain S-box protein [Formosa algae]MBP1840591.1 PAS domain S-box-containing protein [Formosa algae]MDQ0335996.1 PAS domain S-box-containing protein [Formosa algae]OEI81111.1 PAS domain-containing sensor histidine kinase [Formosa algae]
MSQDKIDILQRALAREKAARKQAESILEKKSAELYETNQKLEQSYTELETILSKKDSQLQGVFENIVDAYLIMDLFGNVLKMNDAALQLLGFKVDQTDFNLMSMVQPSDLERVNKSFKSLLEKGTLTDFEIKIKTCLNVEKLVHINASIIFHNKVPIAAQGIIRDITKDKEAEDKLKESENRLATLILNLDSGVVLEDENRKIVLTNKKFTDLFNIDASPSELIGLDCQEAAKQNSLLFKNPEAFLARMDDIDHKKETVLGDELDMVDGKILERNYIPIIHGDQSKGYLWTFKDVTLNRTYRKSLETEKQKYYNIISNMNLGLVELDLDDKILMVNQTFINMTGYTEAELIGVKGKDLFPVHEDKRIIEEQIKARKKGKTASYELRINDKQGNVRYWLISGAPNYDLEGNIIGSIGLNFDITEIKNLEFQKENLLSELAKSNNELQEYAHIVSHDLKSPLRSINALVSWIKEDNTDKLDAASIQNFDLIEVTLEKMEQLITDILDYSSIGAEESDKIEINTQDLVEDLIEILYIPEHISVQITNTLPMVLGHKTKLQQVFQNLISNSVKFIDKPQGIIQISAETLSDSYQFSIQDNGMGIAPQFHDKIFKVFHSLQHSKDSSGIGLSIVQKIVHMHDGKIWLESEPNIGTTFTFTIKK